MISSMVSFRIRLFFGRKRRDSERIFIKLQMSRKPSPSAQIQGDSANAPSGKMKFRVKVTFRKAEAKIYGESAAYPFYRLCHYAAGEAPHSIVSTCSEPKIEAGAKAQQLAHGDQSIALTPKESDCRPFHPSRPGRLPARRRAQFHGLGSGHGLFGRHEAAPPGCGVTESAKAFARTSATVKPKLISEAVEEIHRRQEAQGAIGGRQAVATCRAGFFCG
jgi:hypothetical protein